MGMIEERLDHLGLKLPVEYIPDSGVILPFPKVHVLGRRAIISGHGPQAADGNHVLLPGRLGDGISIEQGAELAQSTALSILASLQRELGSLDRITAWVHILGMVKSTPNFEHQPAVINGFSNLILDVFGPEIGAHARSAVGLTSLPFGIAVEIEGEVLIDT